MKEFKVPSPAINADNVQDYNKRVNEILAESEKREAVFKIGQETVRVHTTGAFKEPYLVTEIQTNGENLIGEPIVEQRVYQSFGKGEQAKLNYKFEVFTADDKGRKVPLPVREPLSSDEYHKAYKEEEKYGLHTLTVEEYEGLAEKLASLKPENKTVKNSKIEN